MIGFIRLFRYPWQLKITFAGSFDSLYILTTKFRWMACCGRAFDIMPASSYYLHSSFRQIRRSGRSSLASRRYRTCVLMQPAQKAWPHLSFKSPSLSSQTKHLDFAYIYNNDVTNTLFPEQRPTWACYSPLRKRCKRHKLIDVPVAIVFIFACPRATAPALHMPNVGFTHLAGPFTARNRPFPVDDRPKTVPFRCLPQDSSLHLEHRKPPWKDESEYEVLYQQQLAREEDQPVYCWGVLQLCLEG